MADDFLSVLFHMGAEAPRRWRHPVTLLAMVFGLGLGIWLSWGGGAFAVIKGAALGAFLGWALGLFLTGLLIFVVIFLVILAVIIGWGWLKGEFGFS